MGKSYAEKKDGNVLILSNELYQLVITSIAT